jgi:oxalate decarboxylase
MMVPPVTDSGTLPNLRFSFSDTHVKLCDGGRTREVTERDMPAAKSIAGVNMRLNPGESMTGVRELHWHPNNDEWQLFLEGRAHDRLQHRQCGPHIRLSGGRCRRRAACHRSLCGEHRQHSHALSGLVRIAPVSGSLVAAWRAKLPPELVKAHLNIPDEIIASLKKERQLIVSGGPALPL